MTDRHRQETGDDYRKVVVQLSDELRVVICKDGVQWILQRRKAGGAERPWRAVRFHRTREGLMRSCALFCSRIDPSALVALMAMPDVIRGWSG